MVNLETLPKAVKENLIKHKQDMISSNNVIIKRYTNKLKSIANNKYNDLLLWEKIRYNRILNDLIQENSELEKELKILLDK